VDVPDYMRISKSKFVNGSIKAALESNGVTVVANQIVETPIEILGKDTFMPPTPPPRKSNMPPL
jgi:hypothetical protein